LSCILILRSNELQYHGKTFMHAGAHCNSMQLEISLLAPQFVPRHTTPRGPVATRGDWFSKTAMLDRNQSVTSRNVMQEGAGWAVILGFGFFFSLITSLIVWVDYTFGGTACVSCEYSNRSECIL
jgi:hypothetical protein